MAEILVTGARGFLGSSLCRRLRQDGHRLVELNSEICDLTRSDSLSAFNDRRYDKIYHLAALTRAGDWCLHHPGEQWIVNQQINANLLGWWRAEQPQAKMIAMGSSCVYDPDLPLAEENYLVGQPIDSLYAYAMSKRMLLVGLRALTRQFGLAHLLLVPTTLYGPHYHKDGRQMHFIFDLIRKILRGKHFGEEVVLWGDGRQKRELSFVEDFVDAAVRLEPDHRDEVINVGCGEEFSIRDYAAAIGDLVGYPADRIRYDASRYVGAKSKCLDIGKLRRLLPDRRQTSLQEGLRITIDWFEREKIY